MREILFRGKRVDNGEWVEGVPVHIIINSYPTNRIELVRSHSYDELDNFNLLSDDEEIIPTTLGQYTGLQDKNGNKIFEGDIVKFEYPSRDVMGIYVVNGIFSFTGVVVFEDGYFALKKKRNNLGYDYLQLYQARAHRDYHDGVIEIIGNIHDNPELLEEQA